MPFEKFMQECKYLLYEFDEDPQLEQPPKEINADLAFPCFSLAKEQKRNPNIIAEELEQKIRIKIRKDSLVKDVKSLGPYLNFYINNKKFSELLLKNVLKEGKKYGSTKVKKETVMIEFSQPNTHKAFHVGHIRGTSLGESISRILEFEGKKVIRANYQGDIGMHVAKWLWCYTKFHKNEKIQEDEKWFASIYVDAAKRLAENEKYQEGVEEINRKLDEKKDKSLMKLWKKTRDICLNSLEKVYKDLGTRFDRYYFESEVEMGGKKKAKDLLENNIAVFSDGAIIINLENYNLGIWVLLRKDGTVLYSAKDISLAQRKFKENKLDKSIYVVAEDQSMHFKQLFKTLELMKFKDVLKCSHIAYGLVRLPTGKMSSRTGNNILYSQFKNEIFDSAKSEIKKRYPGLKAKEIDERSKKISIAAIKYSMLKQDSNSIIVFDPKAAISFEGDTGPYLQYTYARANSILKKSKKKPKNGKLIEENEFKLVIKLSQFSETIKKAGHDYKPHYVANYLFELATLFNEYYHATKVIGSENEAAKLALVKSVTIVLENGLKLLGIETPKEM